MTTWDRKHREVSRSNLTSARRCVATAVAVTVVASIGIAAPSTQAVAVPSKSQPATQTGFVKPFAGAPKYESAAPTQARSAGEINQRLGRKRADAIAAEIGFPKKKTFTKKQYRQLTSGRGVGGTVDAAKLIDASVRILTLPRKRASQARGDLRGPRSVLPSYGLMVNKKGQLQSPANSTAPTRQINSLLVPGGYLGTWCRANGAKKSLRALYRSAYTIEAIYGNKSQQQAGVAQLVKNRKRGATTTVGMSMAPPIWIVNFALIYMISPADAARMPAKWAPIPTRVARAIKKSPTGQVRYSKYAAAF